jgi:hypothetical protein
MLRTGRRAAAIAAIAAGLALAACGSDPTDSAVTIGGQATSGTSPAAGTQPAGGTQGDGTAASTGAAGGVPTALQFRAPLVGGGEFDGTSAAGKPVAFWFWAPT